MNRIPDLRRRRLIRVPYPLRIRLQVNQHPAFGVYIARPGVVGKVISRNLVETVGFLAVDDDFDVV